MAKAESWLMSILNKLGFESLAWSLRRLHCPVDRKALVLEVGSGGNPYGRSNVLLDAYEETRERHWVPLVTDRPTVLGLVENLPFQDGAFDFVIASHVLEHSPDPDQFLIELQRVARAGYIEVPDAFMERVNPYRDHRLEITVRNGKLVIRKKRAWIEDLHLVELYEDRVKPFMTGELIPRHPFAFHVRYYWQGKIDYVVLNPDDVAWKGGEATADAIVSHGPKGGIKDFGLKIFRLVFSQRSRNRKLDWLSLLRCPRCHANVLTRSKDAISCADCGARYAIHNNIPHMFAPGKERIDTL